MKAARVLLVILLILASLALSAMTCRGSVDPAVAAITATIAAKSTYYAGEFYAQLTQRALLTPRP